jgi:hypothetical protein
MQRVADCAKTICFWKPILQAADALRFSLPRMPAGEPSFVVEDGGTLRNGNLCTQAIPGDPHGFEAHPGQTG